MGYTTETIDLSETRKLLIQAIMSTEFLKQIRGFADIKLLTDSYSKYILSWCFEFYDQFGEAPKQTIQSIYENKSAYILKESDAQMIENVLASISEEFLVKTNVAYYVDQAELYFNKLAIKKLQDEIGKLADKGRIDEAINRIGKFHKIDKMAPQGVDLLDNDLVIDEAFSESVDSLFKFPGPLGDILGSFNRGDLSAVIGPQKRGKCITDSYIVTSNGIEKIGDVVDGYGFVEKVITLATKDGLENTSHTYKEVVNDTIEVELTNGVRLEGTPEHPLYGIHEGKLDYHRLDTLKKNDVVAMKLGTNLYGIYSNVTIATLLGYLVANGAYNGSFVFASQNKNIQNHFKSLCDSIMPDSCTILKDGGGCYVGKVLSDILLKEYGMDWTTARYKQIPRCILQGTKEVQLAFLKSLFDCDSYIYREDRVLEFSSASKDSTYAVYAMLANMGIKSDIKEDYNKKYDHTYFNVNVCLEDLKEIFADGSVKYGVLNFECGRKERYNRSNHVPKYGMGVNYLDWRKQSMSD